MLHLLVKEHYCCDELCTQVKSKSSDGCEWCCKRCNSRFTIRIKSFFYSVHISLSVLIMLTYLFASKASVSSVQTTLKQKIGKKSIIQWFTFLREVMSTYLLRHAIKLGGIGNIVEIDESVIGRK